MMKHEKSSYKILKNINEILIKLIFKYDLINFNI